MLFPIGPYVFDWVEFRCVARQIFDGDLTFQRSDVVARDLTFVGGQAVPHDEQAPPQIAPKVLQKANHLLAFERAFHQLEVEVEETKSGDGRHLVPVEMEPQDGSLATRRPGAHPVRTLTDAALIDENYRAAFFSGFFFMAGHCRRFHSAMAGSLRSRARPSGRWQLHLIPRSTFHTCPG